MEPQVSYNPATKPQVSYNPATNYASVDYTNGGKHAGHAPYVLDSIRISARKNREAIERMTKATQEQESIIAELEAKMSDARLDELGALLVFTGVGKCLNPNYFRAYLPWLKQHAYWCGSRVGTPSYCSPMDQYPQFTPTVTAETRRALVRDILNSNNAKATDPIPEKSTLAKPQQPKTLLKDNAKLFDHKSGNTWNWSRIGPTNDYVLILVENSRFPNVNYMLHAGLKALSGIDTLEALNEALVAVGCNTLVLK